MPMTTELASALPDLATPAVAVDLDERAIAFKEDAIRSDRAAYFRANCPRDYADFDLDHPKIQVNRAQLEQVLAWQFNPQGIIASGPTGRGKTRAMFALCRRLLCEEARDVAIWHAQDLFNEIQANVRFGRDEAGDFIKRQAARPVLFIDDYGQEALQASREDWAQSWFMRLLDLRIGHGLPLLITTNLTADKIRNDRGDMAGAPLLRRMLEAANPIKFT